jgi:hypothetical protein
MSHDATVTITLTAAEFQSLARLAMRTLDTDPAAQSLIDQLREKALLANWLRHDVRLELSLVDAALLRDLRHRCRCGQGDCAEREELQPA